MRRYLLAAIVLLPLLAAGAAPQRSAVFGVPDEGYGVSSEDFPGGGSYLGVDTRDVTPERVSALKLKDESGVEVTMVDQDAPAGKAGIKEHDVILTINGNKVESVEQLRRMIRETPSGRVITIGLSRDGQPMNIQAQLAQRKFGGFPKSFKVEIPPIPPIPAMPDMDMPLSVVVVHQHGRSGLVVENLTPQLGDFFGAKDGQGVLVRSVEKGSQAEKAGFHAGDVIVRVEKDSVHDAGDFTHALRSRRSGGAVSVGIIRNKKEQTLTLTLPEQRESGDLLDEESFQFPDVDIEANLHLDKLTSELDQLEPALELAVEQARHGLDEAKKQVCQGQKDLRGRQKEIQKQQQELRKQMRDQSLKLKNELRNQQRELHRELLQLQHNAAEI